MKYVRSAEVAEYLSAVIIHLSIFPKIRYSISFFEVHVKNIYVIYRYYYFSLLITEIQSL